MPGRRQPGRHDALGRDLRHFFPAFAGIGVTQEGKWADPARTMTRGTVTEDDRRQIATKGDFTGAGGFRGAGLCSDCRRSPNGRDHGSHKIR